MGQGRQSQAIRLALEELPQRRLPWAAYGVSYLYSTIAAGTAPVSRENVAQNTHRQSPYYLQNISTVFFCAAEKMLRTIIMQIFRLFQAFFLAKSSWFKSADFASVMTDDVGCSGRHQCTQCESSPGKESANGKQWNACPRPVNLPLSQRFMRTMRVLNTKVLFHLNSMTSFNKIRHRFWTFCWC